MSGDRGARSLNVADLTMETGAIVPTHVHPNEEAMVVMEGELDAVLGNDVIPVSAGQTVLAPAGVRHGFVNRSGSPARIMAIHPTPKIERTLVD